jgi:7,8-dihydropterin-6-yl-methyl-4-(beta-D-ribofuranosyl)aminobenzene 5'-phosphate synthase
MTNSRMHAPTRRSVLGAGAIGLLAAATRSTAEKPVLAVPEVDSLSLQVVTDNATFGPFLDNLDLPGMKVLRTGGGPAHMPRMLPHALLGEFGLSIVGESRLAGQVRRVMVDFGYSREVLANNLALLGIDPGTIDAAVLSHGHLDHYGGFAGLFGEKAPAGRHVPLTVGGEETFCERIALIGDPPPIMGALDRGALGKAGFAVSVNPKPAIIAGQAFTTGVIPLESFERAAIPTQMRPGTGCDRALLAPAKRDLAQLPDDGEHELATCYAVKGLGLVVIASCSHRGVINSVRRAQAVSGIDKVHAVIGGFHLVRPRTEDEARRTVAEFAQIDPTYIIPMHCTGEVFIAEALRLMPQKVVRSYVGSRFVFGAA